MLSDHVKENSKLRSTPEARTIDNLTVADISQTLRTKPQWWEKRLNPDIRNKWLEELETFPRRRWQVLLSGQRVGEQSWAKKARVRGGGQPEPIPGAAEYAIEELEYYARVRKFLKGGEIGSHDHIAFLDDAVPKETLDEFRKAAGRLEDIPENEIDYHPGSNKTVRDLVHPSLYPVIMGFSPVLQSSSEPLRLNNFAKRIAEVVPAGDPDGSPLVPLSFTLGQTFQWLPANFVISPDESSVKITSYINNLHPEIHAELYNLLAKVFCRAIPLLSIVLGNANHKRNEPRPDEGWDGTEEYNFNVPPYKERPLFKEELGGSTMKVIVKMANIELTPEQPVFPGGSWHVEATDTEDIIATVTWYYDIENVEDTQLDFRAPFDSEGMNHVDPDLYAWHYNYRMIKYGLYNRMPCYEALRSMDTKPNRLLVWTNELQHRVPGFRLLDNTKPGHRKIVAFFVCRDPMFSSDRVLPQQRSWYNMDSIESDHIKSLIDTVTLSLEEALEVRTRLMKARGERLVDVVGGEIYSSEGGDLTYTLCEH